MMGTNNNERRTRRNKQTIESVIADAAQELILEKGFSNLNVTAIAKNANISPAVFYKRYNDLDDFLDKFTRKFDYWVNDTIKFEMTKQHPVTNWGNSLIELVDSLNDHRIMQQLLIWELNEDNWITHRTCENRERYTKKIRDYFENAFKDKDDNFLLTSALIVSGIFYIVLFKERATIFGLDFNKKSTMKEFKDNLRILINKIYEDDKKNNKESDPVPAIVKKMIDKGFEMQTILEVTGLSEKQVKALSTGQNIEIKKRGRPRKILNS